MSKAFEERFHLEGGELIRQVTFGMNDGVVSIFALLAGMAGAGQSPTTILITLLIASVAGALSMAAGEFISAKSEKDYFNHEIEQERLEIQLCPEIEREEIREIYRKKGFEGALLEQIVEKITADPDQWVLEMVIDELGTTSVEHSSDIKSSLVIFGAFIVGASFPVFPYLLLATAQITPERLFTISSVVTLAGLFGAGALKKFVTGVNWIKSGFEMLAVGSFAFGVSYVVGLFFSI